MTTRRTDAPLLGFDYGRLSIGVAVGGHVTGTARPLTAIRGGNNTDFAAIDALIAEWQPQALVVGLPLHMNGQDSPLSAAARAFAATLGVRSDLPVHLVDERLSTRAAKAALHKPKKAQIDAEAAAIILTDWLRSET